MRTLLVSDVHHDLIVEPRRCTLMRSLPALFCIAGALICDWMARVVSRARSAGPGVTRRAGAGAGAMDTSSVRKRFLLGPATCSTQAFVQQDPEHIGTAQAQVGLG